MGTTTEDVDEAVECLLREDCQCFTSTGLGLGRDQDAAVITSCYEMTLTAKIVRLASSLRLTSCENYRITHYPGLPDGCPGEAY